MNLKNGFYSVVQYCPDRSRLEAANVGVLLSCPELTYLEARMSQGNDRVRRFFSGENVDLDGLDAAKRALTNRLRVNREAFGSLDDLVAFVDSRANDIVLTPPRTVKIEDPEATLNALFVDLVGTRKTKARAIVLPQLDRVFRSPSLAGRVQFNKEVRIPVVERRIKAPYAFMNGALNLVVPERFPASDRKATGIALRLAAEGDLLQKHQLDDGGRAHLIVVTEFADTRSAGEDLRRRISQLFDEYHVRSFDISQVDALAEEVEREAHP
jgi:hypothetical protein